jgi:hypothetical protein
VQSKKEEEEWFRKFYEGTILVKGWKQRTEEIVEAVPSANQSQARKRLGNLGEKIGREWAKDNNVRRIDSTMLKEWGEELSKTRKNGFDALEKAISKLDAKVDKILLSS